VIPVQAPVTGSEKKETLSGPLAALSEFYQAFNSCDMDAMSRNWAQTDEIAMDNPLGGIKRGSTEIRAVYERIFSGPAKVYVEFYDYTSQEAGDLFYVVGRERGEFKLGDALIKLAIRTSRIFKRMDGTWKQVHHHGSIEDPDVLRKYQTAVLTGKITGSDTIDHVGLNVKDLGESIAFYSDFFGFQVIETWETPRQAFVGHADVILGLLESPGYDFKAHTMAHIAFPCAKQEFPMIVDRIRRKGLEILSGPKEQRGGETVLFRDPSGNILEICYPSISEWNKDR